LGAGLDLVGLDRLGRVAADKLGFESRRRCCHIVVVAAAEAGHSSPSGLVGC